MNTSAPAVLGVRGLAVCERQENGDEARQKASGSPALVGHDTQFRSF
jgi:hypothetical protein